MNIIKLLLFIIFIGFAAFLATYYLSKNDKIVQKNIEINIDVQNILNRNKSQEAD